MDVFMWNSLLKIGKAVAFGVLCRDAHLKKVEGVSWRTIAGMTFSLVLSIFNLSVVHRSAAVKEWLLDVTSATACTVAVYKATNVRGWQDDIVGDIGDFGDKLNLNMRHAAPVVIAAAMALVTAMVACKLSPFNFAEWVAADPRGLLCTFQNFLHGTVLLPQLVVSRRDSYVAPAAARFLLIFGLLHIYELIVDVSVSVRNFFDGSLEMHEISFLTGDIFAAAILLDFLYLFFVNKQRNDIMMRATGLALPV